MKKEKVIEQDKIEEFDIVELESIGVLVLENIKTCFGNLNNDLDEIYSMDWNIRLFEKISKKYLEKIQESHKRVSEWEMERTLKIAKLELKQLRRKGGKNGRKRN